jgi:hypothetical protein
MGTNALEEPAASIFRMPIYQKTEVVTLLAGCKKIRRE